MNAIVNQQPSKSPSEVSYAIQKPYIAVQKLSDKFEIEVIDGFAQGLVNLVKKAFFIEQNHAVLVLERIQSPTFNCYYKEVTELPEHIHTVKVVIHTNDLTVSESVVSL